MQERLDGRRARPDGTNRAPASRTERAQLLLITALALAVILVTVALLLNAAIFTENVATRDTTADGPEATELRGELVQGIGELIETENREGDGSTTNVESDIENMTKMVDRERAREGTIGTVSHSETTSGQLLGWEDEPTEFNAIENDTLVDDPSNARAFVLELENITSLNDPNSTEIEDEAFGVRFMTAGENVTQYIYEDSGTVVIANATDGQDPQEWCSVIESGTTTVDLTGSELRTDDETRECFRGLWPSADLTSIDFINGADTVGNFTLTVDNSADANPDDDPSVKTSDAVYSTTVEISYQTTDLTFETTARVAPGEPR